MKIKDLVKQLQEFDENTDVGGVIVEHINHDCGKDSYCYCSRELYEFRSLSVSKQDIPGPREDKKTFVPKVWIRGDT